MPGVSRYALLRRSARVSVCRSVGVFMPLRHALFRVVAACRPTCCGCMNYVSALNPNRSLELRRIMYLWQTVFLPFCRRRSGLRRDGTEEKTAAEGHKTARSNNITIEFKTLRYNDRFGFNPTSLFYAPPRSLPSTTARFVPFSFKTVRFNVFKPKTSIKTILV